MYDFLFIGEGAGFRALFDNINENLRGALISFRAKNEYSVGKLSNKKTSSVDMLCDGEIETKKIFIDSDLSLIFIDSEDNVEKCVKTLANLVLLRLKNRLFSKIQLVCFGENTARLIKDIIYLGFKDNKDLIEYVDRCFCFISVLAFRSFNKITDNELCLNRLSYVWLDEKNLPYEITKKSDNLYVDSTYLAVLQKDIIEISSLTFVCLKYLTNCKSNGEVLNDEILRSCLARAVFDELSTKIVDRSKALRLCASVFDYLLSIEEYDVADLFNAVLHALKRTLNSLESFENMPNFSFLLACTALAVIEGKAKGYEALSVDMDAESLSYAFFSDVEGLGVQYEQDSFKDINKSLSDIQILGARQAAERI